MNSSRISWISESDPPEAFPAVETAHREPDGLLAAGGDLGPARLLYAYRHGIFPWYEEGQPLLWWSPDPRCLFRPGDFHASRSLRREIRRLQSEIRINTAFADVIRACAGPRRSQQGTWITNAMTAAFEQLHDMGWAHSIEVWQNETLVGGMYGLVIGRAFFGESMFSNTPNASKKALLYVASRLQAGDFVLLDCQVVSSHLQSLGAQAVPRSVFINTLNSACEPATRFDNWPADPVCLRALLSD